MFEMLKESLDNRENALNGEGMMLSEMVSGPEEDFIEAVEDEELTDEDEKKCEKLVDSIPEYELEKENITKEDIQQAEDNVHEPSIEELAESLDLLGGM